MIIQVTTISYPISSTAEAVECLRRGDTLFTDEPGEGWQLDLSCPCWQSKRHIRRFISRHRSEIQQWFGVKIVHFRGSHQV